MASRSVAARELRTTLFGSLDFHSVLLQNDLPRETCHLV